MWLIDVKTLKLVFFQVAPTGKYAILSHRWQDEEIDFTTFKDQEAAKYVSKGLQKVREFCGLIRQLDEVQYAWIDTCCIDKSSSAELSEAINSMFHWYKEAAICYAYLSDVHGTLHWQTECDPEDTEAEEMMQKVADIFLHIDQGLQHEPDQNSQADHSVRRHIAPDLTTMCEFVQSLWFTRGWTLQELIAPHEVRFLNSTWKTIGSRERLSPIIAYMTGIRTTVLRDRLPLDQCSIAEKMYWASTRITTRVEDMAYCLMGLFDVNMPLLYGEGEKAFLRLQQELIRQSDDQTVFLWEHNRGEGRGMLASRPSQFTTPYNNLAYDDAKLCLKEYQMTNKGLQIKADLIPFDVDTYLLPIPAGKTRATDVTSSSSTYYVMLRGGNESNKFTRVRMPNGLDVVTDYHMYPDFDIFKRTSFQQRQLYVSHKATPITQITTGFGFAITRSSYETTGFSSHDMSRLLRHSMYDTVDKKTDWTVFYCRPGNIARGINLELSPEDPYIHTVMLGANEKFNPVVRIFGSYHSATRKAKDKSFWDETGGYNHVDEHGMIVGGPLHEEVWSIMGSRTQYTSRFLRLQNKNHQNPSRLLYHVVISPFGEKHGRNVKWECAWHPAHEDCGIPANDTRPFSCCKEFYPDNTKSNTNAKQMVFPPPERRYRPTSRRVGSLPQR